MKITYTSKALAASTIVVLAGGLAFAAPGQDKPRTPQPPNNPAHEQHRPMGSQSVLDVMMMGVAPVVERITTDPEVAAKLKITPEQVNKLKPILDKAKQQGAALIDKNVAADLELQKELEGQPKPDKAKVSALVKKELQLRGNLADAAVNLIFDVTSVISMEQLKQAFEIASPMPTDPNQGLKKGPDTGPTQGPESGVTPTSDPNKGPTQEPESDRK